MGGFFLVRKNTNLIEDTEKEYFKSLDSFNKRGMKLSKKIQCEYYYLFLFDKYSSNSDNIYFGKDNEFVATCGTLIYNQKIGIEALKEVYHDFDKDKKFYLRLRGNYFLIIHKNDETLLLNDYPGLYRVYTDNSLNLFSSSFLSLYFAKKKININTQEFYEYIFHGSFHNDKTLFNDIKLINSKVIWKISKNKIEELYKEKLPYPDYPSQNNFNQQLEYNASLLEYYFLMLKNLFGNKITSALSGGYDTRLMLAVMRKIGITPKLYVYGKQSSSDVIIAKEIANGESFQLDVIDKSSYPIINIPTFYEFVKSQFYMFDGFGNNGVFDNGSDIDTRIKRTENNLLHLNGGGGEIYRNIWNLPDKEFRILDFIKSYYVNNNYSFCSKKFDNKLFLKNFKIKIQEILDTDSDIINRQQVETLYPFLRLKYFMGINNSLNNSISLTLTPFSEPILTFPSFNIPYKFKKNGLFQSSLIKMFDKKIASYNSNYGFNFLDPLNFNNKLKNVFQVHMPISLRPLIRKWSMHKNANMPYYLGSEYLKEIFNLNKLLVSDFVDISKIYDSDTLSKVLTIELLISGIFK